jgi:hypothetical protein
MNTDAKFPLIGNALKERCQLLAFGISQRRADDSLVFLGNAPNVFESCKSGWRQAEQIHPIHIVD